MIDFGVDIKIDDKGADQAIRRVTSELDRMERASKAARLAAIDLVANEKIGADKQADAIKKLTREIAASDHAMDKAAQSAGLLASQLQRAAVGQGFAGISQHFQRVHDVVERLHGPMREHEADVAALNTAYRNGLISIRDYTNEMARMRTAPKPGGLSSGVVGVAAGVAAAGTSAALGLINEIPQLADAYTNLENRLRRLASTEEGRNTLMERTRQIANASRSEWAATGELFVRLTNATSEMGISQGRTLRLTETISKAFAMSGASATEASAGMLQLSQAFASGRLQGDEFRTLNEAVPDVLRLVAKEMGVTYGELKKLGSEGKITSQVLLDAFEHAQESIDEGFGQTAPTLSQQWTVFKTEMIAVVGDLVKNTNIVQTLGNAFKNLADAIGAAASAYKAFQDLRDLLPGSGSSSTSSGMLGRFESNANRLIDPTGVLGRVANVGEEGRKQQQEFELNSAMAQRMTELYGSADEAIVGMTKELGKLHDDLAATAEAGGTFNQQLERLLANTKQLSERDIGKETKDFAEQLENAVKVDISDWGDKATTKLAAGAAAAKETAESFRLLGEAILGAGKTVDTGLDLSIFGRASVLVKELVDDLAENTKGLKIWADAGRDAATGLSNLEKLYRSITDPVRNFQRDLGLLDQLFKAHRISIEQYDETLSKMLGHLTEADRLRAGFGTRSVTGLSAAFGPRTAGAAQFEAATGEIFGATAGINLGNFDQASPLSPGQFGRDNGTGEQTLERQEQIARSLEQQSRLAKEMNDQIAMQQKLWQGVEAQIGKAADTFVDFMMGAKVSFGDFARSVLADLTKIILKELIAAALKSYLGGGGGGIAQLLMSGGQTPGQAFANVPHAAGGFSGVVNAGSGSGDRTLFAAMVNRGERIDITPAGVTPFVAPSFRGTSSNENAPRERGPKQPINVYLNEGDESDMEDFVIRVLRRNPAHIRAAITGR